MRRVIIHPGAEDDHHPTPEKIRQGQDDAIEFE